MAPLHHNDGPDLQHATPVRTLRPAGMERPEPVAKLDAPAEVETDPKVIRALKGLATLTEAGAHHKVLAAAQAKVDEARLDRLEREAAARLKTRAAQAKATKQKLHDEISRETAHRMSGFAETAVKIGSVVINIKMDKALDPTTRLLCMGDLHRVLAIQDREANRVAKLARIGAPIVLDDARLIRELKDVARRSLHYGCTEISVLGA